MKNMIEVPSEKDFHKTTCVEITQDHNGLYKINYRKINVAMKSITDFTSLENTFEVIDEEKLPEFEKEMEKFMEKAKNHSPLDGLLERPFPPMKKVKVKGTSVSYFSTFTRIIVDDFDDFEKTYFGYLKLSRLDLQN